jgi:hypothetical protein
MRMIDNSILSPECTTLESDRTIRLQQAEQRRAMDDALRTDEHVILSMDETSFTIEENGHTRIVSDGPLFWTLVHETALRLKRVDDEQATR